MREVVFLVNWSRKQKRCFHRMMSGIYRHRKEILRFLTLTSAPDMKRNLADSFNVLLRRMKRIKPIDFMNKGYLTLDALEHIFGENEGLWFESLSYFEYLKVRTEEGYDGVFHILYYGSYYPQGWLSEQWKDITGSARGVDIRQCKSKPYERVNLASYCINQYVAGQSEFVSYFTSKHWCIPGYIKLWNELKKLCRVPIDKPYRIKNDFYVKDKIDFEYLMNVYHAMIDAYDPDGKGGVWF